MPSAEIITVGTELLLGQLVDTNTATIAAALADIGVDVFRETSVGDNEARIAQAVTDALGRADAVICSGGLGPTVDDLTREGIAVATGTELVLDAEVVEDLRAFFASFGRQMSPNNVRQGMFPKGALVLENPKGTAPGFALKVGQKIVVAMPGPPREMEPMLRAHVLPLLVETFGLRETLVTRVLRTTGVSESEIDNKIGDLFRAGVNPSIAVLAHVGEVHVKLTAKAPTKEAAAALIDQLEAEIRRRLGDCIFSSDGASLPSVLGALLRSRGWTIATAESCTGGLIASMLTATPGASDYYRGGVIAYSNEAKIALLDVAASTIESNGAVSEEVASAMALGARAAFRADISIAVTGIAGPTGGTEAKPVGLVYVAVAAQDGRLETRRLQISGDRESVSRRASFAALMLAWRTVRGTRDDATAAKV
ncbi:MAG TPA: competence/damage-inducible protein A [Candidatus Acidoferrales bacterium]|nr:competence/damage-inducible protein A [Candidatus Acidoferrales bacterium]